MNSLVYPARLVDEALVRLREHGIATPLMARHAERVFGKARRRAHGVFERVRSGWATTFGAVATLVPAGAPDEKPRCAGRVVLAE